MTTENKTDVTQAKNLPEKQFRAGAIAATVWKNTGVSKEGQPTEYRTISLERGYKDKNDEWKNTSSMRTGDLPKAVIVMQKAYEYLVLKGQEREAS